MEKEYMDSKAECEGCHEQVYAITLDNKYGPWLCDYCRLKRKKEILNKEEEESMSEQKASLGRIVQYTSLQAKDDAGNPAVQAAIVTRVRDEDKACLTIFYPSGTFVKNEVPYSEAPAPGCWHWPARV